MKVSSAGLRRRISRSLVTVLALSFIQAIAVPVFNPQSADAYTRGTAVAKSAPIGGTGGNVTKTQDCTSGAITGFKVSSSVGEGLYIEGFEIICTPLNEDASLNAASATTTNLFGTATISDSCNAGQVAIGITARISSASIYPGAFFIGGLALRCGNPMSQGNVNARPNYPNVTIGTSTYETYNCPTGNALVGFTIKHGGGIDNITPRCSTFTGFTYAGIGSPTVTNLSTTSSSVAFTPLASNFADTALQYTVTATPNTGSAITNTGSTSPIAIPNLRPNTSYTFSVTASNTYGVTAAATGTTVQSTLGLPSETDTALAITGTQFGWVADTGTNGTFDLATTMTFEAWVYPTETSSTLSIVATKVDSFQLFHIDGIWKYAFRPSGTNFGNGLNTLVPVRTNEWHHIAITRSGNTSRFYYDGVLVYEGTGDVAGSSNLFDNSFPFVIGGKSYDGSTFTFPFKGQIDQVALFSTVRDQATISTDMNSYISPTTAGLRAYYDFNEGSGAIVLNRANALNALSDLAIVGTVGWNDVKIPSSDSSYTSITFPRTYLTSNGGWRIPAGVSQISAVVVAGGGGGNGETDQTGWLGGGGGAGGYRYLTTSVSAGSIQTVQVGQGGRRGMNLSTQTLAISAPMNGGDSIFASVTSLGGGYGGGRSAAGIRGAAGGTGGSGGGGGTYSGSGGAGTAGQGSNGGSSGASCCAGAGGGGAGSIGGSTSTTTGGNAGDGVLNPLYINGTNAQYLAGGGAGGGSVVNGSAGTLGGVAWKTDARGNTGSGGGGGGGGATSYPGGFGGSGVIIIKYLVASSKPIFSGPFNDTTTAGLVETFTVTGTPNSPLVRSYQWQVSTDTGTSWATPTLGSGSNSASYVTPVLTTSVSGSRYQYRVIVTDSDTAGLRMTETSSAVFLIINPALTLTGSTTIQKAINVVKVETFTVTGGTATHRYSLTPTISGITLDTSTALSPVIRISDTKTVGTYYETLTVTDSASAISFLPITIQVIAPPSFSATSEVIESGTVLNLDAASTASYPLSGNTWSDLSGRKITATLNHNTGTSSVNANGATRTGANWLNSVQCVSPTFANDGIGSLTFNGSSTCSYVSNFGYLPTYTYETWLKREGDQSVSSTVITTPYRFTGDQINISLIWNSATALAAGIFNGGTWSSTPLITIPNLTWVHAAVTFTGSTLTLIINGDTTTSTAVSVTWNPAFIDNGLLLGRKWDFSQTFKGSVGSIRIYDRVLALSEIQQNYNATKSRFLTTGNKVALTKRYGTLVTDTYTVTSGLGPISVTLARNLESALRWDTSTVRSTRITAQESLTVGTYLETVTATDALGQSVYLPLRYTVTQADTLTISMDTPTVVTFNNSQITVFPKPVYRGLVGVDTLTVTTRFSSATYTISATRPTSADTYTVSATAPVFTVGAASNYLAVIYETSTAVVNKARQDALNPSIYGASIGSPFSLSLLGGSGDGAITETLTGVSTAPNCAISARSLSSSTTSVAYCTVTFTKASSQNYLSESITVQIFFMSYIINQPAPAVGSGPTIALSGETAITRDPNAAPSISNVTTSGDMTYPIAITGTGFTAANAGSTTIKFWRNQILGAGEFIIKSDTLIWATQPAGATVGKVLVTNNNGTAASPTNFTPVVLTP